MRVKHPDLSQRLADLKLEEMQGKITLKHLTKIGFYLANELHISVPELLHLHRSQRGGAHNSPLCLSLKPDAATRFGLPTLLAASDRRPMIEPPLPWRSSLDSLGNAAESRGGYRYALRGSVPLLTSVPASESDPECPQVVYDALNALQETPWRVNCEVLDVVLKMKAGEEQQSYGSLTPEEQIKRDQEDAIIAEATCEVFQPVLYFVHWLDYRGRVYVSGTHLFPGGPDLSRALLTFAHGRVITAQDKKAIDALDRYGKACLGGRRPFHPEEVARIGQNPVGTRALWWDADDRWQYLAYCLERTALTDALASGKSYKSTLAVWQDASANGLQHMALLLRDPMLASKVNVAGSNGVDIYAEVAEKMTLHLRKMKTKDSSALLKHCGGEITRDRAKSPTMTFGYGAVSKTFYESFAVKEFGLERTKEGLLWKSGAVGDKQRRLASCFASAAWATLKDDAAPKAVELRSWFRKIAEMIGRTKKAATWVVPGTHFPAGQRRSSRAKTGRFRLWWNENGRKEAHQVTAPIKQSTTVDLKSHRKSFAPNVIHSLDAAHLMLTVTGARDENYDTPLGTIHDSFATCASDAPVLEQLFKRGFARIYGPTYIDGEGIVRENNPFLNLVNQLRQQCGNDQTFPKPPEQGNLDVGQVYAASPLH